MTAHTDLEQAFVLFESSEEARRATQKDREVFNVDKFGDRYVRVYPSLASDTADINQAVAQQNMAPPMVGVVRLFVGSVIVQQRCFLGNLCAN
jgi:bifunctional ADP-heptose synthase (sugar kinase/adenylyltransferase)